jgi:hypothetical protein
MRSVNIAQIVGAALSVLLAWLLERLSAMSCVTSPRIVSVSFPQRHVSMYLRILAHA